MITLGERVFLDSSLWLEGVLVLKHEHCIFRISPKSEQIALNHDGLVEASKDKDGVSKSIDLARKVSEPNHLRSVQPTVINCNDNVGRLDVQVLDFVTDEAKESLLFLLLIWRVQGL